MEEIHAYVEIARIGAEYAANRGGHKEARTRGDPAAGRETRGRVVDGKFINHGNRHGRYLTHAIGSPGTPQETDLSPAPCRRAKSRGGDRSGVERRRTRRRQEGREGGKHANGRKTRGGGHRRWDKGNKRTPENKRKAHRRRTEGGGGGGGEVIVVEDRKGGRMVVGVAGSGRGEERAERKRREEGEG